MSQQRFEYGRVLLANHNLVAEELQNSYSLRQITVGQDDSEQSWEVRIGDIDDTEELVLSQRAPQRVDEAASAEEGHEVEAQGRMVGVAERSVESDAEDVAPDFGGKQGGIRRTG
jgi:hypothetical protein